MTAFCQVPSKSNLFVLILPPGESYDLFDLGLTCMEKQTKTLEDKIYEWLNKTGYPLELFAGSILTAHGFSAMNSYMYKDAENSLIRELDINAYKSWGWSEGSLSIDIILECKKSTKPFLLFQNIDGTDISFNIGSYYEPADPVFNSFVKNPFHSVKLEGRSAQGFKMVQSFVDGDEVIRKAVNTLLKASIHWRNEQAEPYFRKTCIEENSHGIFVPVLLLDAPFYGIEIGDTDEIEIQEIDFGILEITDAHYFSYPEFPILVVKRDFLPVFLVNLEQLAQNMLDFLQENPIKNVKNFGKARLEFFEKE